MYHTTLPKKCTRQDCPKSYLPHRWGNLRSANEGWFHQRTGESWCPDHTPDWVAKWREDKKAGRNAK